MSTNKKNLMTVILIISTLISLKTSAMQRNLELTLNQTEMINENQKDWTLKKLEICEELFTRHYEILSKFYIEKPFIKNINIEKYQDDINKEETKYHSFFQNIKNKHNEKYQKLNLRIINIITKIKEIITEMKKTDNIKKRLSKNNKIENMINLLNERTNKIDEHIKKIENKIKEYDISNKDFENDNKENINNINQEINKKYDNIKKEIYNIKADIEKKNLNFNELEKYKEIFSKYNKNLINKKKT